MEALHATLGPDLRIFSLISAAGEFRRVKAPGPGRPTGATISSRIRAAARRAWSLPTSEPVTPVLRDYPFART